MLRHRDEPRRRDVAIFRSNPAQQRLEADDGAGRDIDLRLIMQRKLFIRDGKMQLLGENHFFIRRRLHVRVVELPAVFAGLFRKIHGIVHILENLVDGIAILRIHRHPDAGRQMEDFPEHFGFLAERLDNAVGDHGAVPPITALRQNHDELIAADPADKGIFPRFPTNPLAGLDDNGVAIGVPKCVVHRFEIIQINIQDAAGRLPGAGLLHRRLEPVIQMRPVG